MKNLITTSVALCFLLLSFASCKTSYLAADFDAASSDHVKIAVLPIEMKYTGKYHADKDEALFAKRAAEESQLFQEAMTNEILRNTGRKGMRVKVIPSSTVLSKLTEAGLDVPSTWAADNKELAKLIGVDAVVAGHIVKDQQFSDGVSAGADVATSVLTDVAGDVFGTAGRVLKNNKRVFANYKLVDGETGTILWSADCSTTFDWKTQHHQVIRSTTRRISREFPYRR